MANKTVQVNVSEELLNKLKWIHQGNDEATLIRLALDSYIGKMEKLEGTTYPTDRLPEDALKDIEIEG